MDPRYNITEPGKKYMLYPYAKDLWYRPDINALGMTLEIFNEVESLEFRFSFEVSGKLEWFLEHLEEEIEEDQS